MAFDFVEGSAQSIDVTDDAVLTFPDADWFIGGWLYTVGDSTFQYFVSWNTFGATPSMNMFTNSNSSGDVRVVIEDDDGTNIQETTDAAPFASAGWHHIGLGRDSGTMRIVIDGVVNKSPPLTNFNGINHNGAFRFGGRSDGNSARYTTGRMAEWAKWDRYLSAGELTALASAFSPAFFPQSLMWHVPMLRAEIELREGLTLTNNNSVTVIEHPRMIYPQGGLYVPGIIAAGGGGTILPHMMQLSA